MSSRGTEGLVDMAVISRAQRGKEDALFQDQLGLEALQAICDALAHPARRQILLTVHFREEMSAGQIAGRFAHAWPTTTRHLRVLEKAGLLVHEKHGRARVYRVAREPLALLGEWLAWFDRPAAEAAEAAAAQEQR